VASTEKARRPEGLQAKGDKTQNLKDIPHLKRASSNTVFSVGANHEADSTPAAHADTVSVTDHQNGWAVIE
jgi:hypothetical protein